tara:strand:- start:2289 stop:3281 length:993 start_codon:yes stop_codon:yes gene_type:complete
MTNLSGVYDQYDDGGLFLRKEIGSRGIPAIIKTASDLSSPARRFDDDYALVVGTGLGREYRYPVSDAGNTLVSAMYFSEYGDQLPEEMRKSAAIKIKGALESFGFDVPEQLTKTAAFELGYSGEGENMSLEKLFGVGGEDDPMEIVEDAFDKLSPRGKRRLAMQVKEASATTPDRLEKYSGTSVGSDFSLAVDTRKLVLSGEDKHAELEGLRKKAFAEGVNPEELAEELTLFDTVNEITHLYDRVIPDPYAAVFGNEIEKSASVLGPVEIGGREYTQEAINSWSSSGGIDKIRESFGDDFASQFGTEPAVVLESLPSTHKQAIARMIDEN